MMEQTISNCWPLLFCEVESLTKKNPDGSPFCFSVNAAVLDNGRVLSVAHLLDPDMPKDATFRVLDPSIGNKSQVVTKYAETDPRLDLGFVDLRATGRTYQQGTFENGQIVNVTWCRADRGQLRLGYSTARVEGPCNLYMEIKADGTVQPRLRVTSQPQATDVQRVMLSLPKPAYTVCGAVVTDLWGGLIGLVNFSLPPRENSMTLFMTPVEAITQRPGVVA